MTTGIIILILIIVFASVMAIRKSNCNKKWTKYHEEAKPTTDLILANPSINRTEYRKKYKHPGYTTEVWKEFSVVGGYYNHVDTNFMCEGYIQLNEQNVYDSEAIEVRLKENDVLVGHISRNEKGDLVERLKKEGRIYGIAECFPKYETRESQYYENSYYNVFKGYTQRFSFLSKKNN